MMRASCQLRRQQETGHRVAQEKEPMNDISQLIEENYAKWSNEKFRRMLDRWREGAHMAPNHDTYEAYNRMLKPALEAFKTLHPRAHANWQRDIKENG